jgi:hypothetical protein
MVASPKGLGPEKDCAGKGQQHVQKTDPSSHQRGRPTKTRPWLSNSNKYLVMSPRWGLTPRLTAWLTVSRIVTLTLSSINAVQCSGVERVGWWVSQSVRGLLRFNSSELLLLEAGSWDTGVVRESTVRGISVVRNHYQTMTGEDTEGWESLVVYCRMCEIAVAL